MKPHFLSSALVLIFAVVCASASYAAKANLLPSIAVRQNIAYGRDPLQVMDIYSPQHPQGAPVILMVHGGGWSRGDKAMSNVVTNKVNHWVPQGFIFISINYRLLPDADPIEQANDVARALAFAQRHAAAWGGDPTRFILMGHSAGAHLVALLASDPTIAARQQALPWRGTVCLDSAAFNVVEIMTLPHLALYDNAFGQNPNFWRAASPYYRLVSTPRPILAVYSTHRVESELQSHAFVRKAQALGGRAVRLGEDLSHEQINEYLGLENDYTQQVDRFITSIE